MNLWQMEGNTLSTFINGKAIDNKGRTCYSIHPGGRRKKRKKKETPSS